MSTKLDVHRRSFSLEWHGISRLVYANPVARVIGSELFEVGVLLSSSEFVDGGVVLISVENTYKAPLRLVSACDIGLDVETLRKKGLAIKVDSAALHLHRVGVTPEASLHRHQSVFRSGHRKFSTQ